MCLLVSGNGFQTTSVKMLNTKECKACNAYSYGWERENPYFIDLYCYWCTIKFVVCYPFLEVIDKRSHVTWSFQAIPTLETKLPVISTILSVDVASTGIHRFISASSMPRRASRTCLFRIYQEVLQTIFTTIEDYWKSISDCKLKQWTSRLHRYVMPWICTLGVSPNLNDPCLMRFSAVLSERPYVANGSLRSV